MYGPYGNQRYVEGSLGTDKGYTGQFHDAVTGLDYSNARYDDPVIGQFLSPDSVQGNAQGMDPYSYVGGNPESRTDPTGQRACMSNGNGSCAPCDPHVKGCEPSTRSATNGSSFCGTATHWNGSTCVSNITGCGSNTVLENGKCIADADSKAEQKRQNSLRLLRDSALLMQIAGWILFLVGDYITFSHSNDAFSKWTALVDGGITIATNILPLFVELFGSDSLPTWLNGALSAVMGVMTLAEGWIARLRGAAWWVKDGITMVSDAVAIGVSGPFAAIQTFLFMLVHPLIGNLLDIGGHVLLTAGYGLEAKYTSQEDMPLQEWCAQNGGCPGDTF